MPEFDEAELAAAEALDVEIEALLGGAAGPDSDPTLTWIAASVRTDPPPGLARRIAVERRRWQRRRFLPVRIAGALLAYLFLSHGFGNFFIGGWVADNLGQAESPHAVTEGSLALIAVGIAVTIGVVWQRFLAVAVGSGVPLGVAFGVLGLSEAPTFGVGAALHLSQAAAAIALLVTARRFWRDSDGGPDEEGA